MLDGVGLLEGVEELVQDVLLSLLSRHDIGVLLSIVALTDIVDVKDATAIDVNDLERLLDERLTSTVHWAHDLPQELVVDDLAVVIRVEPIEDGLDLKAVVSDAVALERLLELLAVERARTVVVHDLERLAEVEDTAGTTRLNPLTYAVHKLVIGDELLLSIFLLLPASVTFALNIDALVCGKVTGVSATGGGH